MFCHKCGRYTEEVAEEYLNGNVVLNCTTCLHSSATINGKLVIANPEGKIVFLQPVSVE